MKTYEWSGHPPEELEKALCDLWTAVELVFTDKQKHAIADQNPILDELMECGINGPAGIGLGRLGGHAVEQFMFTRMMEERETKLVQLRSDNPDLRISWDMDRDEFRFMMIEETEKGLVFGEIRESAEIRFNLEIMNSVRFGCRLSISLFKKSREYLEKSPISCPNQAQETDK